MKTFKKELEELINSYSIENESDTPDFLLAQYLSDCLNVYKKAIKQREKWYGRKLPKLLSLRKNRRKI